MDILKIGVHQVLKFRLVYTIEILLEDDNGLNGEITTNNVGFCIREKIQ